MFCDCCYGPGIPSGYFEISVFHLLFYLVSSFAGGMSPARVVEGEEGVRRMAIAKPLYISWINTP